MNGTPNRWARALTIGTSSLASLAFIAFAVQWLLDPVGMARVLGIILTNGDSTSDARAVYGGLELGLGIFIAYCTWSPARRPQGLAAAALTLWGLGLSRFVGIQLAPDGVSGATWQLLTMDLIGAVCCSLTFVVSRRSYRRQAGGKLEFPILT